MTITAVASQAGGNHAENTTSVSRAYPGNVTAGNILLIAGIKFSPGNDAFVVGDLTKTAGTATLGTIALDVNINFNHAATDFIATGLWSVPVTGTGSLTLQVGGALAGSFLLIGSDEYHSDNGQITFETGKTSTGTGTTGAPTTGNITSAGPAQSVFFGAVAINASGSVTITPDGAFTQVYEDEAGTTDMTGSVIRQFVATSTTDAASWTAPTTNEWAAAISSYKEPSGGAIAGVSTITFSGTNQLLGAGALAGVDTITFAGTNTLSGSGALAGVAPVVFSGTNVLSGSGSLAGTGPITFSGINSLSASGILSGTISILFTDSGTLDLPVGGMAGTSVITFSSIGALLASGSLSGSNGLTFSSSGTLTRSGQALGSSRSHKQEKRKSIDWSIPFVVREEELVQLEQKIKKVEEEIIEEKKQVNYTSNIYALNAINNRIDAALETLKILSEQRIQLKKIVNKEVKPIEYNKKTKIEKVLAFLDKLDETDAIKDEKEYEIVFVKKIIRRKNDNQA